jgi:GDPmannose 4,6-dehydratase
VTRAAIITGITGQDGRYAADLLTGKGYIVVGVVRNGEALAKAMALGLPAGVTFAEWDMRDETMLARLLADIQPDEFYNFAAFSTGSGMFENPVAMGDINGLAVTRILNGISLISPHTRFVQASSAEMYGFASGSPQHEGSQFDPRSPYGVAKHYAHHMIGLYRRRTGLFGCSAILFNHESPRRSEAFVTRKVTRAAAAISLGLQTDLVLGSLSARRDWGFAGDYVRAMWLMLQRERAEDYVIATGITHSVENLCRIAFARVGLDYRKHVRVTKQPFRDLEPLQLVGDPRKAAQQLGWSATVTFEQLIAQMVAADLAALDNEESVPEG